MHETFKKIGHLPVNVHFTMNRYPIRNHQCVISKASTSNVSSINSKNNFTSSKVTFESASDPPDFEFYSASLVVDFE